MKIKELGIDGKDVGNVEKIERADGQAENIKFVIRF
jgi:hypothetical protein